MPCVSPRRPNGLPRLGGSAILDPWIILKTSPLCLVFVGLPGYASCGCCFCVSNMSLKTDPLFFMGFLKKEGLRVQGEGVNWEPEP